MNTLFLFYQVINSFGCELTFPTSFVWLFSCWFCVQSLHSAFISPQVPVAGGQPGIWVAVCLMEQFSKPVAWCEDHFHTWTVQSCHQKSINDFLECPELLLPYDLFSEIYSLGFPFWSSSQKTGALFTLLSLPLPVTDYFRGKAAEQRVEKTVGFTLPSWDLSPSGKREEDPPLSFGLRGTPATAIVAVSSSATPGCLKRGKNT